MDAGYLLCDRRERDIDAILISEATIDYINGVGDAVPFSDEARAGPEARSDSGGVGVSRFLQLAFVRRQQITVGEDLILVDRTSSQQRGR